MHSNKILSELNPIPHHTVINQFNTTIQPPNTVNMYLESIHQRAVSIDRAPERPFNTEAENHRCVDQNKPTGEMNPVQHQRT